MTNKRNKEIIEEINKQNALVHGPICDKCAMFASYCRCHNNEEKAKSCDSHEFRVFQSGYGKCVKCKTVQKL